MLTCTTRASPNIPFVQKSETYIVNDEDSEFKLKRMMNDGDDEEKLMIKVVLTFFFLKNFKSSHACMKRL